MELHIVIFPADSALVASDVQKSAPVAEVPNVAEVAKTSGLRLRIRDVPKSAREVYPDEISLLHCGFRWFRYVLRTTQPKSQLLATAWWFR